MPTTLGVLARRTADTRRALLGLFEGPHRLMLALDLMSIHPQYATPENWGFAELVTDAHASGLRRADLLLADEDMCLLVDTAAPSMPDQVLREDDPIIPHGFVQFADPLPDRTGSGISVPVEAMSWSIIPDGHPLLVTQISGATASVLITSYVSTALLTERAGLRMPPNMPRLYPNATVVWQIGTEIGQAFGHSPLDPDANPGFYQRVLAAFWTLAKQPLTEQSNATPPERRDKARYGRAGITNPGKPVRVLRLRHRSASGTPGEATGRHVTVRSLIRGHWKNAYRPSVQAHRLTYVAPHVRGPEGAPLLGGEKVHLVQGERPEDG